MRGAAHSECDVSRLPPEHSAGVELDPPAQPVFTKTPPAMSMPPPAVSTGSPSSPPSMLPASPSPSPGMPPPNPSMGTAHADDVQGGAVRARTARRGFLSALFQRLGCSCCSPPLSGYDSAADVYNPALGFGDGGGVKLEAFRRTQPTARGKAGAGAPVTTKFFMNVGRSKKTKCDICMECRTASGGLLTLKMGKSWSSTALGVKKLTPQHEPQIQAYAMALWHVHEAYAQAFPARSGPQKPLLSPAQFVQLVHHVPLLPSHASKLMVKAFLKARPAVAAEFSFLMPLTDSSKALKTFFAELPEMKRAAHQLAKGPNGREAEVARVIAQGMERAHAAAVSRV